MEVKKLSWRELPEGDVLEAGSSANFKTGDWRTSKPIWSEEKCTNCLMCWIYCPDSSIVVEDGKVRGINYDYCKGCGICAKVCPPKVQAITMVEEK
jgi:pyruvate ferredoxin oxidoreductase delta subunit